MQTSVFYGISKTSEIKSMESEVKTQEMPESPPLRRSNRIAVRRAADGVEEIYKEEQAMRKMKERASKKSKPRGMSYYQKLRKRNIAEKMALLASLGVSTDIKTLHEQVSKKRHLKSVNKRKANNLESLPSRKSLRLLLQGNKDGSLSFETMELAYLAAGQSEDEEDIPSGPLQMKDAYISEPDIWDETKLLLGSIQHFRSETSTKDMNLLPLDEYQSTLEELKVTEESFAKVVPFFIVSMEFYPSTSSVLIAAGDGSGRVGIWDVFSSRGTSERVHLFRPHLMAINCLSFQPYFTHHLLTTSCEGNVRSADLQSLVFEEVYHDPDDLKLTCHTFQSPHTILIGRGDGSVTLVDLRGHQKQKGYNAMYPCHSSKKVKSLCFHPLKKELLLTACFGEVCLWDIRGKMTRPITTLPHSSNVPSALFSPLTGRRIATTCTDDHLRLYESEDPSKINLLRSWYHNAGGSLPFKLKWHPQRDDVFFSSSKLIPHRIEAWNSEGMLLSNLTSEDHLQSFCSVVCHHEHMSIVAGGNRSGRVYLFHKGLKPVS